MTSEGQPNKFRCMINFFNFICEDIQGAFRERREKKITMELDEKIVSNNLEEKLGLFHLRLVKAYARSN